MTGTTMNSIEKMISDGVARKGLVYAASIGSDGTIHCLYFRGGWMREDFNGVNGFAGAQEYDMRVTFSPIEVNVIRLSNDQQVIAPEDIPLVLKKIKELSMLFKR